MNFYGIEKASINPSAWGLIFLIKIYFQSLNAIIWLGLIKLSEIRSLLQFNSIYTPNKLHKSIKIFLIVKSDCFCKLIWKLWKV